MVFDKDSLLSRFPDILPRDSDSVFTRYVEAHEEELGDFEVDIDEVIDSLQIDNASGEDLDRIGALFGDIGQRNGRTDQEYRLYLKTIVQAFKSRGTIPGIRTALGAGLDIPDNELDDTLTILEHFEDLEYTIELEDWPSHEGATVEDLADFADASVARLRKTTYKIDPDSVGVTDSVSTSESTAVVGDSITVDDVTDVQEILINPLSWQDYGQTDDNWNETRWVDPDELRWESATWGQATWTVE